MCYGYSYTQWVYTDNKCKIYIIIEHELLIDVPFMKAVFATHKINMFTCIIGCVLLIYGGNMHAYTSHGQLILSTYLLFSMIPMVHNQFNQIFFFKLQDSWHVQCLFSEFCYWVLIQSNTFSFFSTHQKYSISALSVWTIQVATYCGTQPAEASFSRRNTFI